MQKGSDDDDDNKLKIYKGKKNSRESYQLALNGLNTSSQHFD